MPRLNKQFAALEKNFAPITGSLGAERVQPSMLEIGAPSLMSYLQAKLTTLVFFASAMAPRPQFLARSRGAGGVSAPP